MKRPLGLLCALVTLSALSVSAQVPSLISYQGRLVSGTNLYSGSTTIVFRLYGSLLGADVQYVETQTVAVVDGLYSTRFGGIPDYGTLAAALTNQPLFLEVQVGGTVLTPRERIAAVAYAVVAEGVEAGAITSAMLADNAVTSNKIANNAVSSANIVNNSLTAADLATGSVDTDELVDGAVTWWKLQDGGYWRLVGNAGTTSDTHFIGTTDGQPLDFKVNGSRAFRLVPNASGPSVIGGSEANTNVNSMYGVTIAGGGTAVFPNRAGGSHSTISGGYGNEIDTTLAVIGGGYLNAVRSLASAGVIGGGEYNAISNSSPFAVIGGGFGHSIGTNSYYATIAGGRGNTVAGYASLISGGSNNMVKGSSSVVGGGEDNTAIADRSVVGGGASNVMSNAWACVIGGGVGNTIIAPYGSEYSTIAGGLGGRIENSADYATIGGGEGNLVSNQYATIAGGWRNVARGQSSTVGGGSFNDTRGFDATVAGGRNNAAREDYAFVGGGRDNQVSNEYSAITGGRTNRILAAPYSFIGGGSDNIGRDESYIVIGGGNRNDALARFATIAGGTRNVAGGLASSVGGGTNNQAVGVFSTVAGGRGNLANAEGAAVAGGSGNGADALSFVGGGYGNLAAARAGVIGGGSNNAVAAGADYSAIGGGVNNQVGGDYATIPGGRDNLASNAYAFAAGRRARATNDGAFVWGDSIDMDVGSRGANSVTFRCDGGVSFQNFDESSYARWTPGAGGWTVVSDRALKEHIAPVDSRDVLEKVAALPIAEWNYKGYEQRNIGPMAQDFHALFPFEGSSDTSLNSGHLDGVSLAAIQGLYAMVKELQAENKSLKKNLADLRSRLPDGRPGQP